MNTNERNRFHNKKSKLKMKKIEIFNKKQILLYIKTTFLIPIRKLNKQNNNKLSKI